MRSYVSKLYVMPSQTYTAGGTANQPLNILPKEDQGRICHLAAISYNVTFAPTFTTAPTVIGANNLVAACDFWDGKILRFLGGFNHLRMRERQSAARVRVPDSDTGDSSTTARYFRRTWHAGPPHFAGAPGDFAIPTGLLENAEIRFRYGALTDISADTTACTGTIRCTAQLILMDEIRIPPAYQYLNQAAGAADVLLAGRALYESIFMLNSSSFDAIAAGDFSNLRLDFGKGDLIASPQCEDVQNAFLDAFSAGEIGAVVGEPEHATNDDFSKQVNRASPTAIAATAFDLQALLFSPPECRISKLFEAQSVAHIIWSGTQTTSQLLFGRFLPQEKSVVAAMGLQAIGKLNRQFKDLRVKTLSKDPYDGPYAEYMPWKVDLG